MAVKYIDTLFSNKIIYQPVFFKKSNDQVNSYVVGCYAGVVAGFSSLECVL